MLHRIEAQYGKANRIWVMDRGIPTEEVLAEMRAPDPPVSYLVGTPNPLPEGGDILPVFTAVVMNRRTENCL